MNFLYKIKLVASDDDGGHRIQVQLPLSLYTNIVDGIGNEDKEKCQACC